MRVMFVTLGCRCNQFETAAMEAALRDRGHEIVTEAPDVAVVNGCAVTAESARKSRQAARRLLKRWPEAKFSVWADAPLVPELAALMARRFPNVAIYTGDKEPETDADLLLVSSGSGIAGSVRRSIGVWRSSRADRPVAAYAIGYSSSLKALISTFDFCFFRDREVLARAEAAGYLKA